MKLLGSSNYENKEVINFLKAQFSTIENGSEKFVTSQFLEMDELNVAIKEGNYRVTFWGLKDKSLNFKTNVHKDFNNRVDAIKFILAHLGIIRKSELN